MITQSFYTIFFLIGKTIEASIHWFNDLMHK